MKFPLKAYIPLLLIVVIIGGATSCNNTTTIDPVAKNSVTGSVEGTAFTADDLEAEKDSNNVFSIKGTINRDASFSLYIKDDGSSFHPVEQEGAFRDFAEHLESLFNSSPPLADSVLQDSLRSGLEILLSDTENLLAPNHSFMFYTVGGLIYYSLDGSYTMTDLDEELNRINGSLNIRLSNFFGGRKDMEAVFDDVQFYQQQ